MVVGVCTIAIHLPFSHSLKDKRRVIKGLKDSLRSRHNVSVAEVDCLDLWQRAVLGVAAVADSAPPLESIFNAIMAEIESRIPGEVVDKTVDYY